MPEKARDQAKAAVETTNRATEDLQQGKPNEVPPHQNQARDALNRLAQALPDANQRRQEAQRAINEARNRTNQVARDLERHLRETAPRPNRPADPVASARDLARRIEPLVQRQEEAARFLENLDVTPDDEPQRQRAAHRARPSPTPSTPSAKPPPPNRPPTAPPNAPTIGTCLAPSRSTPIPRSRSTGPST